MRISIIAAIANNGVIGRENKLPWHLPADMKHFRQLTMGKPMIMGRKTSESIGKPLPGRKNIIITHDPNFQVEGCIVAHSPKEALEAAEGDEVMVIGGSEIYRQFLSLADRMYLTWVHADFVGDAYFPEFNQNDWQEKKRQDFQPDEKNSYPYSFVILERESKSAE